MISCGPSNEKSVFNPTLQRERHEAVERIQRQASVDLRLVQTGLDDGDLGIVGNDETWHAADGCQGARVGADPIAERLRPGRLDVGEEF